MPQHPRDNKTRRVHPMTVGVLLISASGITAGMGLAACARTRTPQGSEPAASTDVRAVDRDRYVDTCLAKQVEGENSSQLWRDLAKFAFALPEEDTVPERAESALDRAVSTVAGLNSEASWSSAGRYFQAENFHAFERPACVRAWKLKK